MRIAFVSFIFVFASLSLQEIQAQRLESFDSHFAKSPLGKVQSKESAGFKVQWVHPRDEIFVDALLSYLEAADQDLKPLFSAASGLKVKKVPVEIFPDLKTFSAVSGLSLARFKATGTIALTLDQRLMILSPRTMTGGYSWAITVVHEYVHYLIREIAPDHIPIWLHEGTAQLYQGFPYEKDPQLRPMQWGLFKRFKDKKELLNLETLKEPFPYRKTPEEAELAYVEALLFVKWLDKKCGVLKLIQKTAALRDLDKALTFCTGLTPAQLNARFIPEILNPIVIPNLKEVAFFARDFSGKDPLDVESRQASKANRNLAQLSSELFKQGRWRASGLEMEKALSNEPTSPPSWRRQLANSYLRSGQSQQAVRELDRLLHDYPDDAAAWYILGAERLKNKQTESGWQAFLRAFFVNPFLDGLHEGMQAMKEQSPSLTYKLD